MVLTAEAIMKMKKPELARHLDEIIHYLEF